MVTTVGTEDRLEDLLSDLIKLDYDAIAAYQAAIERLEDPTFRRMMDEFKADHERHISDLSEILASIGVEPPQEGDAKSLLTKGKVVIAGLIGDKAILQAMRTNEDDTNTAYERAVQFKGLPGSTQEALQRGLEDERRHRAWIIEQLERL